MFGNIQRNTLVQKHNLAQSVLDAGFKALMAIAINSLLFPLNSLHKWVMDRAH
jgi:hypothetical protein